MYLDICVSIIYSRLKNADCRIYLWHESLEPFLRASCNDSFRLKLLFVRRLLNFVGLLIVGRVSWVVGRRNVSVVARTTVVSGITRVARVSDLTWVGGGRVRTHWRVRMRRVRTGRVVVRVGRLIVSRVRRGCLLVGSVVRRSVRLSVNVRVSRSCGEKAIISEKFSRNYLRG